MEARRTIQPARKQRKKIRITQAFVPECVIYIALVCNFFILLGNPIGNERMVSIATRILLLSSLVAGAWVVVNSCMHFVNEGTALFIGFLACTLFAGIMNGVAVFAASFVNVACFLMLPIYIINAQFVANITRLKKSIYLANVAYGVVFIYLYFSPYAYIGLSEYGKYASAVLTLGYSNPNETGMYLILSLMIMLTAMAGVKNVLLKLPLLGLSVVLGYFIVLTSSRICMLIAILFVGILLIRGERWAGRGIRMLALMVPFLFAAAMSLAPVWFDDWSIFGETVQTGRTEIYLDALKTVEPWTFLFGNLKDYAGQNLHNGYLSIFIEFGAITLVLFFLMLRKTMTAYGDRLISREGRLAQAAVLCLVLHSTVEGAFFVAGAVYAGLAGLVFVLMREEGAEDQPGQRTGTIAQTTVLRRRNPWK